MKYRNLIDNYKKYLSTDNEYDIELEGINFIIQETNHLSRSDLILSLDKEVENEDKLISLLDDYCVKHIPCQYLIGYTYFYGLKFKVTRDVLIPRFDTEILVDEVIKYINTRKIKLRCVDIGTGSGAIAIAVSKNCDVMMDAVDISSKALEVAKLNGKINEVNVNFIESDLLNNTSSKYNIIVSNPPYIDINDKSEGVSKMVDEFEPHLALYSSDHGLYHYKKILDLSVERLSEDGVIFFEIPDNKCEKIREYALKYYKDVKVVEDYHHLRRVLIIENRR